MTHRTVLLVVLMAACGGKSAPDSTTPKGAGEPVGQVSRDTAPADAAPADTPPDPAQVKADLVAAEQAAYEKAKPVFGTYCAKCHSKDSKKAKPKTLGHFDMTSY